MNNDNNPIELEKSMFLGGARRQLESALPELTKLYNSVNVNTGAIDYQVYDDIRNLATEIIWAAQNTVRSLTDEINEKVEFPVRGPIAGAALKPRMDTEDILKDQIVYYLLISAAQVLRSDFDTVTDLAVELSDICEKHINSEST